MKKFTILAMIAFAASVFSVNAADEAKPEVKPKTEKKELTEEQKKARNEIRDKYDADKNGKLDKEERAKISEEDKAKLKKAGLGGEGRGGKKKKKADK